MTSVSGSTLLREEIRANLPDVAAARFGLSGGAQESGAIAHTVSKAWAHRLRWGNVLSLGGLQGTSFEGLNIQIGATSGTHHLHVLLGTALVRNWLCKGIIYTVSYSNSYILSLPQWSTL